MAFGRSQVNPTQPAHVAPMMSWPVAPMLNSPARNASATDNPARASGVASTSVRPMAACVPRELV
jgi:hypothetical protein